MPSMHLRFRLALLAASTIFLPFGWCCTCSFPGTAKHVVAAPCSICVGRFDTAVRSSTLTRLAKTDRAVTVRTRSLAVRPHP